MADRDLRIREFLKLMRAHGCEADINRKNFVKVSRAVARGVLTWSQHTHRGLHDTFRRHVVHAARRKLDLENLPDDDFYRPLS